ncbi:MAG TPA: hypothetical protein VIV11_10790 [Kofleriaceae bacterium]
MQARKQRRRAIAIALAFIAAAGLGVAAFGERWLTNPAEGGTWGYDQAGFERATGMGLRTYERCSGANCASVTNFELIDLLEAEIERVKALNATLPAKDQLALPRKPWHGFPVVGMIAFVCALIAAAGLLVGGALALTGKRPVVPIMPTTIAVLGLIGSIIAGCIFVATKPEMAEPMVVGWTFMAYGGAAVVGLAAVFPLNRAIRPIDVELGEAGSTMSWGGSRDDQP